MEVLELATNEKEEVKPSVPSTSTVQGGTINEGRGASKRKLPGNEDDDDDDGYDEDELFPYSVESILEKRMMNGGVYYLIKWRGRDASENTWVPREYFERKPSENNHLSSKVDSVEAVAAQEGYRNGFDRGLTPLKILGVAKSGPDGQMRLLMKWENSDVADLVNSLEACVRCSEVVVRFFEAPICWRPSMSSEEEIDVSVVDKKIKKLSLASRDDQNGKNGDDNGGNADDDENGGEKRMDED